MSRPPSVRVTRALPHIRTLVQLYRKETDGDKVRRLHAIILMKRKRNAEKVAELCEVTPNTIRRWVEAFNAGGLEGLYKKKAPAAPPP